METQTLGRVTVAATIENLDDVYGREKGRLKLDDVRTVTSPEALVDTGATLLSMPTSLIRQLGLTQSGSRLVTSSTGECEAKMYSAVRLTIMGRWCTMDVLEVPDGVPVLIGQIPLEHLDFVVDPQGRRLIGNPAHGGEHVYEMY